MPRFVVLLRGVNVGTGNRVPMAEFRALLTKLGYTDVATLLNSGNAVFSSSRTSTAAHAKAIGNALADSLGVRVPTIVKSAAELTAIVAANPLEVPAAEHPRLLVAFAQEADAIRALESLAALAEPPEQFVVGVHAAYLHCPNGISNSDSAATLLGKSGRAITTRNMATVLKLHALARR
jgi:uncharacterized protein (DUF1697 family)